MYFVLQLHKSNLCVSEGTQIFCLPLSRIFTSMTCCFPFYSLTIVYWQNHSDCKSVFLFIYLLSHIDKTFPTVKMCHCCFRGLISEDIPVYSLVYKEFSSMSKWIALLFVLLIHCHIVLHMHKNISKFKFEFQLHFTVNWFLLWIVFCQITTSTRK